MFEMLLYDAANSPCARRVRMVLLEKGVPFDIRWMNLALLDQKQLWYLTINPNGLIPTLVHKDRVIFESGVINEYLEAEFPDPPLMPAGSVEKAEVRMWLAFELNWAVPFREVLYETFGKDRVRTNASSVEEIELEVRQRTSQNHYVDFAKSLYTEPPNRKLISTRRDILMERMQLMEDRLVGKKSWLVGSKYSLADFGLIPRIDMFPLIGISDLYDRFPRIGEWAARVKELPVWSRSDIRPTQGETETRIDPRS